MKPSKRTTDPTARKVAVRAPFTASISAVVRSISAGFICEAIARFQIMS